MLYILHVLLHHNIDWSGFFCFNFVLFWGGGYENIFPYVHRQHGFVVFYQ